MTILIDLPLAVIYISVFAILNKKYKIIGELVTLVKKQFQILLKDKTFWIISLVGFISQLVLITYNANHDTFLENYAFSTDQPVIVNVTYKMVKANILDPQFYYYSHLPFYFMMPVVFLMYYLTQGNFGLVLISVRILGKLVGFISTILIYRICEKLEVNKNLTNIIILLFWLNPLVLDQIQGISRIPDTLLIFSILLFTLNLINYINDGNSKNRSFLIFALALSLNAKLTSLTLFPLSLLLILYSAFKDNFEIKKFIVYGIKEGLKIGGFLVLSFFICSPYFLISAPNSFRLFMNQFNAAVSGYAGQPDKSYFRHLQLNLIYQGSGVTFSLLIFFFIGLLFIFYRIKNSSFHIQDFALVFFILVFVWSGLLFLISLVMIRYYLPLVPLFLIISGYLVNVGLTNNQKIEKSKVIKWKLSFNIYKYTTLILFLLLIISTISYSIYRTNIYNELDNYNTKEVAAEYMLNNFDINESIMYGLYTYVPSEFTNADYVDFRVSLVIENNPNYIIISSEYYDRFSMEENYQVDSFGEFYVKLFGGNLNYTLFNEFKPNGTSISGSIFSPFIAFESYLGFNLSNDGYYGPTIRIYKRT